MSTSALSRHATGMDDDAELKAESHSSSGLLAALLGGATRKGAALDGTHLLFGEYVVTLTPPGAPRMPNGIECRVRLAPGAPVAIGRGRLTAGRFVIDPGPAWNPTPVFERFASLPPGPEPSSGAAGAWLGYEALVAGYVAGLTLLHGQRRRAETIALRVAEEADPLDATLLRHAARGEVPEPLHWLLATRSTERLIASSAAGMAWLRGLLSAGLPLDAAATVVAGRR